MLYKRVLAVAGMLGLQNVVSGQPTMATKSGGFVGEPSAGAPKAIYPTLVSGEYHLPPGVANDV